jgi:hypothetical protein
MGFLVVFRVNSDYLPKWNYLICLGNVEHSRVEEVHGNLCSRILLVVILNILKIDFLISSICMVLINTIAI